MTRTWQGLNEAEREVATKKYAAALIAASKAGNKLNGVQIDFIEATQAATQSASGYDLALAGIAGQMGGATGQAMNLVIAMREHNKAQDQAAAAGQATVKKFGELRTGAAMLSFALASVGEAVGGTAGKVLTELSGIAEAFAKGGIVGAIIAGIGSLIKGLKSLFSRGKKKREAAAKAAEEAAEAAKKIADAMDLVHRALLDLPTLIAVEDFKLLRDVWDAMNPAERARGMDNYAAALLEASDAGIVLTAIEQSLLDAFVARDTAMKEATARQKAEVDGARCPARKPRCLASTRKSTPSSPVCGQRSAS